tara:strand:+ start:6790 stop:8316 length:1527 start_codon:yes stop_codon:yes gene_type:complete
LNIVITLAGKSLRFKSQGYNKEKFLLNIGENKTILNKVVEMFNFNDTFHFVVSKSQSKIPNLKKYLVSLTKKNYIHIVEDHNKGPVFSVLKIKDINLDEPIIITYCDFFVKWDYKRFLRNIYEFDGSIPVFKGFHPSSYSGTLYAYIKSDKKKNFIEIKEKESFTKKPQNEYTSCGIYYFKSFKLFKYFAHKMLNEIKGEAYVSLIYNYMHKEKLKSNIFEVEKFICLGTPFDYINYLFWQKYFRSNILFKTNIKSKTFNLIPMAGKGKRFKDYGYRVPKPLIQINKLPMLKLATNTFPKPKNWTFIINERDDKSNRIEKLINKINLNSKIIKVKKLTEGPASSCYLAKNYINQNEPLFISSCDYLTIFNEKKWNRLIKDKSIDGVIWTSKLHDQIVKSYNAFGYCRVNKKNSVKKIVEKRTISNNPKNDHMMIGSFWFKKASYFFNNYLEAKRKKLRINNEYYVGNNINLLIKKKYKFVIFQIDQWISLGDPFELKIFEYWKNLFEN